MTKKIPAHQACPNGERCALTQGVWMQVPTMFNPKHGEKVFWPGLSRRCSHECMSEQYDKAFAKEGHS